MTAVIVEYKATVCGAEYLLRHIFTRTASAARASVLGNTDIQHNRVNNLDNGCGEIIRYIAKLGFIAEAADTVVALEYIDIAFAAVKYYRFFDNGDTAEACGTSETNASFEFKLDVESDLDLIEASVEAYRFNSNVAEKNARFYNAYIRGAFNQLLSFGRKEYGNIFKAITVAAAVKHVTRIYNDRFAA